MNLMNNSQLYSRLLCWIAFSVSTVSWVIADERPNIVLVMADDMGFSDIGCFGSEIQTPALDQLAEDGVVFTQFYNGARCCPTRAALLSGLYAHQAGMGGMEPDWNEPGYRGNINRKCVTLAEALKENGYATFMTGKWHLTNKVNVRNEEDKFNWPRQRGFDRFYGTISGGGSYYAPKSLTLDNEDISKQAADDEDFYYTDAISDHTIKFIDEHCQDKAEKPFFHYVSYTAPHWPLHALREDRAKYEGKYDEGWDVLREQRFARIQKMDLLAGDWKLSTRSLNRSWVDLPKDDLPKQFEQIKVVNKDNLHRFMSMKMEIYAAQIDRMDQGIGRIVKCLKSNDILDNTLLVFLADNGGCAEYGNYGGLTARKEHNTFEENGGPLSYDSYGAGWACASNTPFRFFKHFVHEGGIATPLIVHWPAKVKPDGVLRRQVGHIIDMMPTFLAAAGGQYPEKYAGEVIPPMEGENLLPAVIENAVIEREPLCWEHHGNRAVRIGDWKLVAAGETSPWQLYNMKDDRTELNDLAKEQPERVKEMNDIWWAWAKRCNVLPMNPNKKKKAKSAVKRKTK
jgi:arylsulfatase A-like enzyme